MKNPVSKMLGCTLLVFSLLISQMAISQPCVTPPTSNAGVNSTICSNATFLLGGSIGGSATTATWTTNGTGSFLPGSAFGTATSYAPSAADIIAGTVTLTLTTDDPDGAGDCIPAVASLTLTITSDPLSGTYTVDAAQPASCTNFVSIASAIANLNTRGISGNVLINVAANHTETAPVDGLTINQCALASGLRSGALQTITFQKSGVGANPVITANAGSGSTDYVFGIAGADYVTIDGINILENGSNATASSMMEYGYILYPCSGTDGAQHNTITNCSVTLNKVNTNLSKGIAISTFGVTVTATGGTDSDNKIYANTITNSYYGVYCMGFASASPYDLYDQNNEVGAVGQGNNISNFGNAVAAGSAAAGVYSIYNNNIIISSNTINSAGSPSNTNSIRGIFVDRALHAHTTIVSNTITVAIASGATAVSAYGIYNLSGARKNRLDGIVNAVNINSNTIIGSSYPSTGTGNCVSIYNGADFNGAAVDSLSAYTLNINNNTITNNTSAGIAPVASKIDSSFIQIYNQWAVNTLNINSNIITGNNYTNTTATNTNISNRGIVTGIGFASVTNWTQITNIQNNTLTNNNSNTSTATDGGAIHNIDQEIYGTNGGAAAGSQYNATGNIMGSVTQTIAKSGKYRGILAAGANNVAYDISHNKILSVTRSSMTGTFIGYQLTIGTGISPASVTFNWDSVGTISTGGTAADAFTGVSGNGGATSTINLTNNKVYSVTMTSTAGCTFTGVTSASTTCPTVNIINNAVYNNTISTVAATTSAQTVFNGITNAGNVNILTLTMDRDSVYGNSHFGNGSASSTFCIVGGNVINSTISNCYIYNNTRTSTSTSTNSAFTGIQVNGNTSQTTSNNIVNNYIRFNTSAGVGTGNMNLISLGSGIVVNVTGNSILNNYKTGTSGGGTIWGVLNNGGGGTFNCLNNTIRGNGYTNITATSNASGTVNGISSSFGSSFSNTNFTGNVIDSLFISGPGSGATTGGTITGLNNLNPVDFSVNTISGNTISNLKINSNFNLTTITGLRTNYNTTVSKNKIYTLIANGSGGNVTGIYTEKGILTISNNYVGDLKASSSTLNNAVTDLYSIAQYAATVNVYNNTFVIDNTVTGSGAQFGTSNVQVDVGVTLKLVNNILINLSTPGGSGSSGGVAACLRRPTGVGMNATYDPASNNNIFYAGNPTPQNLLYIEGTTWNASGQSTLAGFQAAALGRESFSKSENETFVSNTPSSATYLHLSGATLAESGGIAIGGITTDFDNDTRAGNPGYIGTGSAPDIGADEFAGTTTAPVFANVSITPTGSICTGTSIRTVSADVTSTSGTIQSVTLDYSFNGVSQAPVTMLNSVGNTWTGDIPASIPANAIVVWSMTAVSNGGLTGNYTSGASYQDNYTTNYTTTSAVTPSQICDGSSANLSVNTNNLTTGNYTIGVMVPGSSNTNLSPFRLQNFGSNLPNPQAGNKQQILFTGAELQAAGMIPGNIYGMTYYILSNSTFPAASQNYVLPNHTVRIGTTSNLSLPSTVFQPDPANIVYGPQNTPYPPAPGVWTLTFTTPYNWDGTSNILIQMCNDSNIVPMPAFTQVPAVNVAADFSPAGNYKGSYQINAVTNACSATGCTANQSGRPIITFIADKQQNVTSTFNYSWNSGAFTGSTATVSPSVTTPYSVSGTDPNGCIVNPPVVSLTVNPVPAAPVASNSSHCGTQTPSASVTGSGGTFNWYLVPTGGTALPNQTGSSLVNYPVGATTTFYVSETSNGCEGPRTPVTVTVSSQPDAVTASATSTSGICPFTNNTLSVNQTGNNNTYTYSWSASPAPGSGIPVSITGTPGAVIQATAGGTYIYTVTATDAGSQCATTSTVSVTYTNPPITPVPTATPSTYCDGGSTTLSANAFTPMNATISSNLTTSVTGIGAGSLNTAYDIKNNSIYPVTLHYVSFGAYTGGVGLTFNLNMFYKTGGMGCTLPTIADFPSTWTYIGTAPVTPADYAANGVFTLIPLDINITIAPGATIALAIQGGFLAGQNVSGISCPGTPPQPTANDGNLIIYEGASGNTGLSWTFNRRMLGSITYDYQVTGNYTYSWSPNTNLATPLAATTTANPSTSTSYTVQVTDVATSCSNYGNVMANVTPLPAAPTANNNSQCGAGVPNCTVTGTGSSYKWYLVPTGGTALPGETLDHLTSYIVTSTTTFYVSQIVNSCEGPRAAVVQTIGGYDPIQASNLSSTCLGSQLNLTVAQTGNTNTYVYTWTASPFTGSGLSGSTPGDLVDGHLNVIPTVNGTYVYTVTGYDAVSGCTAIATYTAVVADAPVIATATANPATVCSGYNDTLIAKTNTSTSFAGVIGTSTNVINGGSVGPFTTNSESSRIQYLITASELTAAGLTANSSINQISFKIVTAVPTFPWNNYRISMGHTLNTALTTTWENPAALVYNSNVSATSLPITGGLMPFNITPFVWDGTSNLVVQICYANDVNANCTSCSNGATTVQINQTTTPFNSVHYYTQNDYDACGATNNGTLANTRPNLVLSGSSPSTGAGSLSWVWNPGNLSGNSVIVNPTVSTVYNVTATVPGSNCSTTQGIVVEVNPLPGAPVSNGPSNQCGVGVPTASVTSQGGTLLWYLTPTGGTPIPNESGTSLTSYSISTTTTFYVAESNGQCESARVAVIANVTQPDAVSASAPANACGNSSVALSATQTTFTNSNNYTVFSWTANPSAGSGITGSVSGQNVSVSPSAGGTFVYTVTATDPVAGCATTSTVSVVVTPPPHIDNVVSTINPVCSSTPVTITAKTLISGNMTGIIGTGTTNLTTGSALPFGTGNESQRVQYLITAAELTAAGLQPGNINKVTFVVTSATGVTIGWDGYTIKMGHTSLTALTNNAAGWEQSLTTVYGPTNLPPSGVVAGNNVFNFTSPFTWNGTSNVVVDICWANDPLNICNSNCSSNGTIAVPATVTSTSSVHHNIAASGTFPTLCGQVPTGTVVNTRPNMILSGVSSILSAGSYTWQWNPGAVNSNAITVTPLNVPTTSYTVTATDPVTTCTTTQVYDQTVIQSPTAPVGTNSSQCGSGVPTCSVTSAGGNLNWYLTPTGGTAIGVANDHGQQLSTYSISATTTFYVSEFNGQCEGPRGVVVATVNVQPDGISATGPGTVCFGSDVNLSAAKTGNTNGNVYTYSWSANPVSGSGMSSPTPGQNVMVTPTVPGTYIYTATATDASQGCGTTATATVIVAAPPVTPAPTASETTVCPGSSSTLNANAYNYTAASVQTPISAQSSVSTANWFNIDNTSAYPLTVHTFSIVAFSSSTQATVFYSTTPLPNCATLPTLANFTAIGTFAISGLGSTQFTTIPANLNITIPAGQTYAFVVSVNGILYSANGSGNCAIVGQDANLAIHDGFGGTIAVSTFSVRPNIKVDYDITVGSPTYTYSWTPPATLSNSTISNPVATPVANTTYSVVVTDPASGCTSSGSVEVTIGGITSTPIISPATINICNSGPVNMNVTAPDAGVTYTWQTSTTGSAGTWTNIGTGIGIIAPSISDNTYYRVYATCGGASDTSAISLATVLKPEMVSYTGAARCGSGPVTINLTGTGSFDWYETASSTNPLASNTGTYSPTVNSNTTYWIQAYIGSCLHAGRQPVNVVVNTPPFISVSANPGTTLCGGGPVTVTATSTNDPNYSYSWSLDGGTTMIATGSAYTFTPSATTTVNVYGNDASGGPNAGCGTYSSITISVLEQPAVPVVTPAAPVICTPNGCTDLTVSNPDTGAHIYPGFSPSSTSIGTRVINGGFGQIFTVSQPLTIKSVEMYFAANVGTPYSVLIFDNATQTLLFTYIGSVVHQGLGNGTPDIVPLNATLTPGTYRIEMGADPGTYNNSTGAVYPYTIPGVISIIANTAGLAPSYYFYFYNWVVTTPELAVYSWNPGNMTGTEQTVCPTSTTTYTVTASFTNGCTSTATTTVNYQPIVVPTITPSGPTTICNGGSVSLDAGAGYASYSWSDGVNIVSTSQVYVAAPSVTTTYTVTVSNGFCSESSSVEITIQALTSPTITTNVSPTICQGSSVIMDAGAGYATYSWSDGTNVVSTSQTYTTNSAGTYTVTVTAANGCSASDNETVLVNPTPAAPVITPSGPFTLCDDDRDGPLVLVADTTGAGAGVSMTWNNFDGSSGTNQISVNGSDLDFLAFGNPYGFELTIANSYGCFAVSNSVIVTSVTCPPQTVTLNVKAFIEGYYTGNGLMDNFGTGGCLFVTGNSLSTSDADSLFISLMDPVTYAPVANATGILHTNGTISVTMPSLVSGNSYYIKLVHRNALQTWSAAPVLMTSPAVTYDFTTASNKAYGSNMIESFDAMGWMIYSGDISDANNTGLGLGYQDEIIESADYTDMENAVSIIKLGYVFEDVTGDGIVESADYTLMENAVSAIRFSIHP